MNGFRFLAVASAAVIAVGCVGSGAAQNSIKAAPSDPSSPAPSSERPVETEASQSASTDTADIVVTANRRSERLQNVAIAVAAFDGASLKAQGLTSTTDIAKFAPGVNVSGTLGGQGLQFSIRGVTQSDYNDAIEAPVAVYIDDTYVASQQGQGMGLYDIERVEALKGPQGTLFGRNATGGLVHFLVNKPEL